MTPANSTSTRLSSLCHHLIVIGVLSCHHEAINRTKGQADSHQSQAIQVLFTTGSNTGYTTAIIADSHMNSVIMHLYCCNLSINEANPMHEFEMISEITKYREKGWVSYAAQLVLPAKNLNHEIVLCSIILVAIVWYL